jgi:hypothetical protein
LELRPKETFTPRLQEGMVRLATWMPFRQASEQLEFFMGTKVGATTVRQTTEQAGQAQVQRQENKVATIQAQCPASPPGPEVQLLSVDGAFLQLVGGEWKEVKTLAVGVVGKPVQENGEQVVHTTQLSYFSRMSDAKEFERQALVEIHERGVEKAGVVCAVTDGAEWIQTFVDVHRADAVRILDFAHAMEKVTAVGKTLEEQQLIFDLLDPKWEAKSSKGKKLGKTKKKKEGEGTKSCHREGQRAAERSKARLQGWLDGQAQELKTGEAALVVQEIERLLLLIQARGNAQAAETIAKCLKYLKERQSMITYASFGEQGYPIGSGSVESANKLVVESRMKGSGMRWGQEHVDAMLALRNAACNDSWKPMWKQVRKQWVQQTQIKRALKSANRLQQQQPLQVVELPTQPLTERVPAARLIPAQPLATPAAASGPCCQTLEVIPAAQSSSSGHLKPEASSPKGHRPACTHPWRRPFLRPRPAS